MALAQLLVLSFFFSGVLSENNSSAEPLRLVGGFSRCAGTLEVKHRGEWRRVKTCNSWNLGASIAVCRELDCGYAVSGGDRDDFPQSPVWEISSDCVMKSTVSECVRSTDSSSSLGVDLVCSEPLRLVGGASRCDGTVEVKLRGEWRRGVNYDLWDLGALAAVCRDLDCGSAVSGGDRDDFPQSPVWYISSDCVMESTVTECVMSTDSSSSQGVEVVCSDLLNRPIISLSVLDGASESQLQGVRVMPGSKFRVECSVEPQFPGGSFQLLSPTVNLTQNHTLPAVNHSAHFLFSDTGPAHKGNYTCVYLMQVFNHTFSSQSHALQLYLGGSDSHLIFRVLVVLLLIVIVVLLLYYCKVRARGGDRETPEVELELDLFRSS